MRRLIPYMADPQKAADYFRDRRWLSGVVCPFCGAKGSDIQKRGRCPNGVHRYSCLRCAQRKGQKFATFTDRTGTIFEGSKLPPDVWLLIINLWGLGLNATQIARAAEINRRSAQRACNLLDGAIYGSYHLDPERELGSVVEADEIYQTAGHKGSNERADDRAPRKRGLKERGRGSWEKGRPPVLGLAQRRPKDKEIEPPPAQVYLEVTKNVQTETVKPIITARVREGSELHTDEFDIYNFAERAGYKHYTVNHSQGEWARHEGGRVVHCNTVEGIWSALRIFLARFRGINKRFLHLRVARFEFLHNHGHMAFLDLITAALGYIFAAAARYLRRMVHQHRRIPLTGCYR